MEGSPQELVCQLLQFACSQDVNLVKEAELKLSEWEIQPGFHLTLINIFANKQIDMNIRWMAILCCRNGVNKYWRKHARNEIQQSEKCQIKSQLLLHYSEPINQIAVQVADLIRIISRHDYPKEWPEIIPILLDGIISTDSLVQHRSLLVLLHVIKAQSSKRMAPDKQLFMELTRNIFSIILNLWNSLTTSLFQSLLDNKISLCIGNNVQDIENLCVSAQRALSLSPMSTNNGQETPTLILEKALLLLRILRKLTVYGFSLESSFTSKYKMFLETVFRRMKEFLEFRLL